MHYRSCAGGFYQSTTPFSPICPIKSCTPPRSRHRASSISDMVGATRSQSYTPNSTTGVEASKRQGRPLVPASPPAADIIVAPPVVEHHSTHQRCDRQGRFSRTSNARPRRRTMSQSRREAIEEPAVPLVPRLEEDEYSVVEILDVMPPIIAAHDAHAQPPLLPVRKHSCSIISVLTYIAFVLQSILRLNKHFH